MLGVYLSIKTNTLTGRNISRFTVFDLSNPLSSHKLMAVSFKPVLFPKCFCQERVGGYLVAEVRSDVG